MTRAGLTLRLEQLQNLIDEGLLESAEVLSQFLLETAEEKLGDVLLCMSELAFKKKEFLRSLVT